MVTITPFNGIITDFTGVRFTFGKNIFGVEITVILVWVGFFV